MADVEQRFFCHQCSMEIPRVAADFTCPTCNSGSFKFSRCFLFHFLAALHEYNTSDKMCPCLGFIEELGQGAGPPGGGGGGAHDEDSDHEVVLCSAPSVPQPVVQSRRRPLLGPSPG